MNEEWERQKRSVGWDALMKRLRPVGGRPWKRPTEEERAKIAEAKAELEARRKRQEPQETTSGVSPVSWEEEARAAAPAEGEPDALAF